MILEEVVSGQCSMSSPPFLQFHDGRLWRQQADITYNMCKNTNLVKLAS